MAHFDLVIGIDRLKALHLNDSKFGLGERRPTTPISEKANSGLSAFRLVVNDPRLAGLPGILETEKGNDGDDDRRNLATLRSLQPRLPRLPNLNQPALKANRAAIVAAPVRSCR